MIRFHCQTTQKPIEKAELSLSLPPIKRGFFTFEYGNQPSDQATKMCWVLHPGTQPYQEEHLINNKVEDHIEFPAFMLNPPEVKGNRCLNPAMYPFTLSTASHECREFWVKKILVSEMHSDLFHSSVLEEELQLLSQGSVDISPCSPELVDPMSDSVHISFILENCSFPDIDAGPGIQMIPDLGISQSAPSLQFTFNYIFI